MKVLPVLDLRHGVCVRAVAGNRDSYGPVNMRGLASPTPAETARWYRDQFGLGELYVADLSAIMGEEPAWDGYAELENAGFQLWLDAGIGSLSAWQRQVAARDIHGGRRKLVAALESLRSPVDFESLAPAMVIDDGCFSLDLRHGKLWTEVAEWSEWPPTRFVDMLVTAGVRRLIILDVGAVGTASGPAALELCRYCHKLDPGVELTSGGGVRGIDDLRRLRDAGCSAALVATALQSEWISRGELESL